MSVNNGGVIKHFGENRIKFDSSVVFQYHEVVCHKGITFLFFGHEGDSVWRKSDALDAMWYVNLENSVAKSHRDCFFRLPWRTAVFGGVGHRESLMQLHSWTMHAKVMGRLRLITSVLKSTAVLETRGLDGR